MAENKQYKAIRIREFGKEEVMKVETMDDLWNDLDDFQIVLSIKAFGINPVETYRRSGSYPVLPKLPYTPGSDAAGVVERIGSKVSKFKPGDRVWIRGLMTGSYTQKALTTEDFCFPLPDSLSFAQGAAINIAYATAYRALFIRGIGRREKGLKVLVHGASGGVGIATVQLALDAGMTVFATAGSPEGLELVKKQGAHFVYDHKSDPNYAKTILSDSESGVDMVVEMLANVNLDTDISLLRKGGAIMVVGNRGTIEINPRGLMGKESDVRGVALGLASEEEKKETFSALAEGILRGGLVPVVGEEREGLESVVQCHKDIIGTRRLGKLVVIP